MKTLAILVSVSLVLPASAGWGMTFTGGRHTAEMGTHSALFEGQALKERGAFFPRSIADLNSKASVSATSALIATGLLVGTAEASVWNRGSPEEPWQAVLITALSVGASYLLTMIPGRPADYFQRIEKKQAKLIRKGIFREPRLITWEEKRRDGSKIVRSLLARYEFAVPSPEIVEGMRKVILSAERSLRNRGLLTENQIRLLELYEKEPERLDKRIRDVLRHNPWTLIARDPANTIVGLVFPAFGRAHTADDLPGTMRKMTRWQAPPGRRRLTAGIDFWFTGYDFAETKGNGAIAEAMLDMSVQLAQELGVKRLFAYSNPRGLPVHPEHPPVNEYAARVVAGFALPRILQFSEAVHISSWALLEEYIRAVMPEYVTKINVRLISDELIAALQRFAKAQGLDENSETPDLAKLLTLATSDKATFIIHDPAITTHLRRGAKLARIIRGAFPTIFSGPGIGGGFSFVMIYDVNKTATAVRKWLKEKRLNLRVTRIIIVHQIHFPRKTAGARQLQSVLRSAA